VRIEDHQRAEIEFMKHDIAEKDAQILHLTRQTEKLSSITNLFYHLLLDLEQSSGEQFLPSEQRPPNELPSAHGLFALVQKALMTIITLHTEMAKRFEADFAGRVDSALNRLHCDEEEIARIQADRLRITTEISRLNRLADIQRNERDSLESMARSLNLQMLQSAKHRDVETGIIREQIETVQESIVALQSTVRTKKEKTMKAEEESQTQPPKRVLDAVKADIALNQRIEALRKLVERETFDRKLSEAELVHVRVEIERAHAMINTFKMNLTKEKQMNADNVNSKLKQFIEQQREDYRRAIANQRKRNMELDKQKVELTDEERMLVGVLQGLEKHLQIQMQKLPSLAQLQQRTTVISTSIQRRGTPAKTMKPMDSAEMRGIRKAILLLKVRKGLSKSVLVGSRFH
jgi:hypothetical protein